jgi:hypothetical protein
MRLPTMDQGDDRDLALAGDRSERATPLDQQELAREGGLEGREDEEQPEQA